jgi:alcohol dehydrogenase (cytochrome c)
VQSDRYVNISTINHANVSGLHVICSGSLGTPTSFQSGPIVVGGTLYVTESTQTFALNAATRKKAWVNTYAHGGVTNRGAAYAGGLLFRGFGDGHVSAINAATGATVWNRSVIGAGSLEFISAAPIVWQSTVIIGTANGDSGQLCHVLALDQKTGRLVWSAQTVPDPGAPLAKTWKGATHIAGGATWTSFTIDPATGALYVPVGNPGPDYDIRDRLGSNLYTNSVLEMSAATGTLARAMQLVPQDAHDWDQAATPAVVTLAGGTKIALVAGKDGYLRSVDLKTFTQHWQRAITTIANAAAPIVTTGTHFCPGGGVFWNGAAYSPATGLAYVNAVDWCRTVYLEPKPVPYVPGKGWFGSSNVVKDSARSGWLSAVNASTGAVLWNYHSTLPLLAGVTPTSGGLVFTADLLGNVLAFNASSGALLRKVATGLPVGGGVISYAVSGKQYVAVAAGMYDTGFTTTKVNPAIVVLGL